MLPQQSDQFIEGFCLWLIWRAETDLDPKSTIADYRECNRDTTVRDKTMSGVGNATSRKVIVQLPLIQLSVRRRIIRLRTRNLVNNKGLSCERIRLQIDRHCCLRLPHANVENNLS